MDIEQEVLAAFQVEHREQLQRMRALLLDLEGSDPAAREQCIDEAFRMAHNFKGGARVCDLRPVEAMGHGLETLFSRVRDGILEVDAQIVRSINIVLDGIEDWMAALLQNGDAPEPTQALRTMERLLGPAPAAGGSNGISPSSTSEDAPEIEGQLRSAFYNEYTGYVDGLAEFLKRCTEADDGKLPDFDEAFWLAHDLRASARAAQLSDAESLAVPLETAFRGLRDGTVEFTADMHATLRTALHNIQCCITAGRCAADNMARPSRPLETSDLELPVRAERKPDAEPTGTLVHREKQIETVRIRAESLDRLLHSSSQLLTEGLQQDQVTRGLEELKQTVELMQSERETLRRLATAGLHRLEESPELRRVAHYFESVERNLHVLSQKTRKLYSKQQRSSWLVRSHGLRIQADVKEARMVSADSLFQAFPKMVRDLARDEKKQVDFRLIGSEVRVDRMVLQALKDPVMHMLRNAVIHGIEPSGQRLAAGKPPAGQVTLEVKATGNRLLITLQDDGKGVDLKRVAQVAAQRNGSSEDAEAKVSPEELAKRIFEPGFSTSTAVTELAGRGMGLSVVHETVKRLQGSVQLIDQQQGTGFLLSVPLSISTHRVLIVAAGEQQLAVPLHAIERLVRIRSEEIETLENVPLVMYRKQMIPVLQLAALLESGDDAGVPSGEYISTIVLKVGSRRVALAVERILNEHDALVQNLDAPAARAEFSGAMLNEDGEAVLVLNPSYLCECEPPPPRPSGVRPQARTDRQALKVLVVDDSFTTRTLEKSILETHGYQVHVAMDGIEALAKLQAHKFDAVISDLEMPRLDGFGLLEKMRQQENLSAVPFILVTSRDCPADRERGLELGAEAYIVKRKFDHQDLLKTIEQVIAS